MPFPSRKRALYLACIVGITAGLLTWLAFSRADAAAADAPDPWYSWFIVPSFIGVMLSGGVHGGAPLWVLTLAACGSNGLVWAGAVYGAARVFSRLTGKRAA